MSDSPDNSPDPQTEQLFHRAVELTQEQRDALLEAACRGNPAMRREVESLLASHDSATADFLQTHSLAGTDGDGAQFAAGDVIGDRYELLHALGEGGLGIVWLAEQRPPVRRKVAIKFIRLGMSSHVVLGRFETERNALALMNHPNIARVLDAGTTSNGQPFFVMEHVQGLPITRFCNQGRLTTRQRLELFIDVCSGVQHAHQKGVIHRDLKPSNLLVTRHDGRPLPKIIDFGIAKATRGDLADRTIVTMPGQLLGTPEYMSPEQAEMSEIGVDSTSDIYSLGVVLYELVTGVLPFESDALRRHGLAELQRVMREIDPPTPSTRIAALGHGGTHLERLGTDPSALRSQLKGDIDWIVMKALEKDRTRRYASASEMAADLRRHLRNEPVLASPPSRLYLLRKFARRNRTTVTLLTTVAVALVAGIAATTVALLDAQRERNRATAAQLAAEHNSRREDAVSMLLLHYIGFAHPAAIDNEQLTVIEMLDKADKSIPRLFAGPGQELEQAAARTMLSSVYNLMDDQERGERQVRLAIRALERSAGKDHPDLIEPLKHLAHLRSLDDSHGPILPINRRIVEITARSIADREPRLGAALTMLGRAAYERDERPAPSEITDAVQVTLEALQVHRLGAIDRERVALAMHLLAWSLHERWRIGREARPLLRRSRDLTSYRGSWQQRVTRMWSAWMLLRDLDEVGGPDGDVRLARELRAEVEWFPRENQQRFVLSLRIPEPLSRAGLHDEAMTLAMATCELAIANRLDWTGRSPYHLHWVHLALGNLMDVARRAGRMDEVVDPIGRWTGLVRREPRGLAAMMTAWEIVRRSGWHDALFPGGYRDALRTAEHGLQAPGAHAVIGRLAAAVAKLRLATSKAEIDALRSVAAELDRIVASLPPATTEEMERLDIAAQALPALALVQHRIGETAAARASLQRARQHRHLDRGPGSLFLEAEAAIDRR